MQLTGDSAADGMEKASHKQVIFQFGGDAESHVNDQVLGSFITTASPPPQSHILHTSYTGAGGLPKSTGLQFGEILEAEN